MDKPLSRTLWPCLPWLFGLVTLGAFYLSISQDAARLLPEAAGDDEFIPLRENSPFQRSIGLSRSIVLTGVARVEGEIFAVVHNRETRETLLVSSQSNSLGWQLLSLHGDASDPDSLSAQIRVAGNELVSIRYERIPAERGQVGNMGPGLNGRSGGPGAESLTRDQQDEAKRAAVDYRAGYSADGYPEEPPREIVAKLSRLSVEQREGINRQMIELRNRGLGMEERRNIYEHSVDRALQGGR